MNVENDHDVQYPKWERIFYAVGIGTIVVGLILKYNHIRYAEYFLLFGIGISLISYLFGFFTKKKNEEADDSLLDQ